LAKPSDLAARSSADTPHLAHDLAALYSRFSQRAAERFLHRVLDAEVGGGGRNDRPLVAGVSECAENPIQVLDRAR
jgi:hypothetical protein